MSDEKQRSYAKSRLRSIWNYAYIKVILVIIALVLPLNVISIMQNTETRNSMIQQARLTLQNLADTHVKEMESRMKNSQDMLVQFLLEDADCNTMKAQGQDEYQYESAKMKVHYNLKNMGSRISGADGYFYYMEKRKDFLSWGKQVRGFKIQSVMEQYVHQALKGEIRGWHIRELNGRRFLILLLDGKDIAYGSWIELDPVVKKLETGIEYEDYSLDFQREQAEPEESHEISIVSAKKDILLNIRVPKAEILGKVSFYQKLTRSMVFLYLILIPVLYVFLRHLLLKPLKRVMEAHRQLRKGNQEHRIEEKANSAEFGEVYESFNRMADELKTLKIQSYEKEIERQKMELRNLQLQIRPHFLLNTFNLIYTLAQRKLNEPIQEVILYLSDYFRYIFRSHKDLELFPKEMHMIEGYIKMASIRYSDRIEFESNLDPEINFVRTPPLLIHNFIENAVKYGLKQDSVLHITLTGEYENGRVIFNIMDDGNGMESAELKREQKLLSGALEPDQPNSHVGLMNSMKRLKYFYGEEARIEMESEPGEMMCFKIEFPYNLEDEDESVDRE